MADSMAARRLRIRVASRQKRIHGAAAGLVALPIKPWAHLFSSFEKGNGLLRDLDDDASTRVAPRVRSASLGRKRTETSQLDSITATQSFGDFVQYCGDDLVNVSLKKVRVLSGNALYEIGFYHVD
jgi:hypothetical protein